MGAGCEDVMNHHEKQLAEKGQGREPEPNTLLPLSSGFGTVCLNEALQPKSINSPAHRYYFCSSSSLLFVVFMG